jgi:hypothetical protein
MKHLLVYFIDILSFNLSDEIKKIYSIADLAEL